MKNELHVIFGAGQVGTTLANILLAEGKQVRLVKRQPNALSSKAELMLGDATDPTFCHQACAGAEIVYHCMNPEYNTKVWADKLPKYMDNLIAATGNVGARLVVLDNLYMLGNTAGQPMDENTQLNPCSKKGEIRAKVAESLFTAHRQGRVNAICGRASDFYGPQGKLSFFGDFFWKPVLAGKAAMFPVNINMPHTYHYIPDVAQGLAALGTANFSAFGRAWMLPCQPAVSSLELIKRFEPYLGRSIKLSSPPRWLLKPLGFIVPMLGEMSEMSYQWETPFIVDDRNFRENFMVRPTAEEEAARATVDWGTKKYSA